MDCRVFWKSVENVTAGDLPGSREPVHGVGPLSHHHAKLGQVSSTAGARTGLAFASVAVTRYRSSQRCFWYVAGTRTLNTPSPAFASPSLPSSCIGKSAQSFSYSASAFRMYFPGATAWSFSTGFVSPAASFAVTTTGTSAFGWAGSC